MAESTSAAPSSATASAPSAGDADLDFILGVKLTTDAHGCRLVGLAFADSQHKTLEVAQLLDNDKFDNLRSVLTLRPAIALCLLAFDAARCGPADKQRVQELMSEFNINTQEGRANEQEPQNELAKLVPNIEQHFNLFDLPHALNACLLACLSGGLLAEGGQYKLSMFDLEQFLHVDQPARVALNLFRAPTDSSPDMNLLGLLNKCRTAMGARLLTSFIRQPLRDIDKINQRLDIVEALVGDHELRQTLRDDHLRKIPDLARLIRNFQKKRASLQAMVSLYGFARKMPAIWSQLREYTGKHSALIEREFVVPLEQLMGQLGQFQALVESTVDLDQVDALHQYCVRPDFDDNLMALHKKKQSMYKAMGAIADEAGGDSGVSVKLVEGIHEWALKVTRKDEKAMRAHRQYIQLDTKKDGVRFTTTDLRRLSKEYGQLCSVYDKAQDEIVQHALAIAASYTPVLETANELIARLDVFLSLAHVSCNAPIPYVRPVLLPSSAGRLDLIKARHPMLEVQPGTSFIPNDIRMVKGESNIQIITGPNMSGKSVYIRQTGVIVLMAQLGCFVPCDSATVSVCDSIMARVGAGDVQLKGVSTFMKEMLEAASIVKAATPNSLIIIDELGRGTSTYDGFGVAWAIAEHIGTKIKAFTMFATHFHELTALADVEPCVVNRHVTADLSSDERITMLYQVKDGKADRSFGVPVAKLAHFPDSVVDMAKRKADQLENFGGRDQQAAKRMTIAGKRVSAQQSDRIDAFLTEALNAHEQKQSKSFLSALADGPAVARAIEEAVV